MLPPRVWKAKNIVYKDIIVKSLRVNLGKRSYPIIIGSKVISGLGVLSKKIFRGCDAVYIITNAYLKKRYAMTLDKPLRRAGLKIKFRLIPDSEESKSLSVASAILNDLALFSKKRRVFILAFGGGVAGDLAGFVAAIFKRGIPYGQLPTTLLAQVDSAIGGKTGVDLAQGKNLAGAFYQPRLVLSDMDFLKTLSTRQLRNGLAEVIKYALIKDAGLFSYLERNYRALLEADSAALNFVVRCCSSIKSEIVSYDEREEKNIRTMLNFGHTIGHAIEAAGKYRLYAHGEAIALGMLVAAEISYGLRLIDSDTLSRIERLLESVGLPVRIQNIALQHIISAHYSDKKFSGAKNRFVVLEKIGRAKIAENVPLELIKKSIRVRF